MERLDQQLSVIRGARLDQFTSTSSEEWRIKKQKMINNTSAHFPDFNEGLSSNTRDRNSYIVREMADKCH